MANLIRGLFLCMARRDGKFDLQSVSQCGRTCDCLSRSVREIHWDVKQPTNTNKQKIGHCGVRHGAIVNTQAGLT